MENCNHNRTVKFGTTPSGKQRFRCLDCRKTFTQETQTLDGMRIGPDRAAKIIQCLSEGMGVRGAGRMTGAGKGTILDTLALVGARCKRYMEEAITNVPVRDVQADELWSFVGMKEKTRIKKSLPQTFCGDKYCYVAMERHNKLVLAWQLGDRDLDVGREFVAKLARACWKNPFQITTDGWSHYKPLMRKQFGHCDFGMLIKLFTDAAGAGRYSPGTIVEIKKKAIHGDPDESRMCTSHVERGNLTIRMGMRRFTRLTNGFSKKVENHELALGLHFALYNFVTIHGTLRTTPAVAAGVAAQPWSIAELIDRTKDYGSLPVKAGPKSDIERIIDDVTEDDEE